MTSFSTEANTNKDTQSLEEKYEEVCQELDEIRCVARLTEHDDPSVRKAALEYLRVLAHPVNDEEQ
jgi:hypothetical protein